MSISHTTRIGALSETEKQQLSALIVEGGSWREIAKKFNLSHFVLEIFYF